MYSRADRKQLEQLLSTYANVLGNDRHGPDQFDYNWFPNNADAIIHYVSDVKIELTDEVRNWAEKAKSEGKFRLFGFSAHKNMEDSFLAAAQLGWMAS